LLPPGTNKEYKVYAMVRHTDPASKAQMPHNVTVNWSVDMPGHSKPKTGHFEFKKESPGRIDLEDAPKGMRAEETEFRALWPKYPSFTNWELLTGFNVDEQAPEGVALVARETLLGAERSGASGAGTSSGSGSSTPFQTFQDPSRK
jgi:hypothetical protein